MQKIVVAIGILNLGLVSTVVGDDTATLIQQLGSWSKNKAKKASDELAAMGSKVVPELIEALNGKGRRQRRFAARTLRQVGQDAADAIPALSKALEDSDALTREYAVEALGKMVKEADQVIPVLTEARKDRDRNVREQARAAIVRLTELRKLQGQADSADNESPVATTQGPGTKDTELGNSAASLGEYPPRDGGYSGKQILMVSMRCALFACIIAGFFALLHVYREDPH